MFVVIRVATPASLRVSIPESLAGLSIYFRSSLISLLSCDLGGEGEWGRAILLGKCFRGCHNVGSRASRFDSCPEVRGRASAHGIKIKKPWGRPLLRALEEVTEREQMATTSPSALAPCPPSPQNPAHPSSVDAGTRCLQLMNGCCECWYGSAQWWPLRGGGGLPMVLWEGGPEGEPGHRQAHSHGQQRGSSPHFSEAGGGWPGWGGPVHRCLYRS
jgi:hypothetical protein